MIKFSFCWAFFIEVHTKWIHYSFHSCPTFWQETSFTLKIVIRLLRTHAGPIINFCIITISSGGWILRRINLYAALRFGLSVRKTCAAKIFRDPILLSISILTTDSESAWKIKWNQYPNVTYCNNHFLIPYLDLHTVSFHSAPSMHYKMDKNKATRCLTLFPKRILNNCVLIHQGATRSKGAICTNSLSVHPITRIAVAF